MAGSGGLRRGRPGSVYKFGSSASSAASQLNEVNSLTEPKDRVRHVFGDLLDESDETRRQHRERLGDNFFAKFDSSGQNLPEGGPIQPCGCDTFPSTRARLDTLATADVESKLRAHALIDESYQTSVEAVLVAEGSGSTPLLEIVRETFGVDEATHKQCIAQVATIVDALDAEVVVNLSDLHVTLPDGLHPAGSDGEPAVLAMIETTNGETPETTSKKALAKRLRKAIAEAAATAAAGGVEGEPELGKLRELLEQGADPNLSTSRKGNAMTLAAELNRPAITTLLVEKGGDPTLEPNSKRAFSKAAINASSGVFETVPVEVRDNAAHFPDHFVLPVPSGGAGTAAGGGGGGGGGVAGATVSIEIWRTNAQPASPPPPVATTATTPDPDGAGAGAAVPPPTTPKSSATAQKARRDGKRKRVRRRFFGGRARKEEGGGGEGGEGGSPDGGDDDPIRRPSTVVIEKNGVMLEFLGVVRVGLEALALGKPQTLALSTAADGGGGEVKHPSSSETRPEIGVELTVRLSSDLTEILRRRRKQHQDVLSKLLQSATRSYRRLPEESRQAWVGRELYDFLPIVQLHARWARMPRLACAVDVFCAVVEVSGQMAVSAAVVLPLLQELCDAAPAPGGLAEAVDAPTLERLVAALECVATTYFHVAAHPHKCVERDDAGMAELSACVGVLQLVYQIDAWQQATIGLGQTVDDDPDAPIPLDAPILAEAAELIDRQLLASKIDYRSVKAALLAGHSVETFECHKRTVQQLCAEAAAELDRRRAAEGGGGFDEGLDSAANATVVKRAREIIAESSRKLLTYPTVKSQLVKEFGVRAVAEHRRVISAEIVMAMGRRLSVMARLKQLNGDTAPPCRVLALELTTALENFVKECYENIRHRVKVSLASEFEGHELVMLVRTMEALEVELEGIKSWYHAAYRGVPGMVLTNSFAMWYDKLVSADLRSVLSMWEDRCTENNFPFLFFNLLFSARHLWDWMESNLGELPAADFRLHQYEAWFYPFVEAWLIQSKAAALQMVERAINLDQWRPVSDHRLVSESSLDITRIVYEVVQMYQKIDWPDREANEERFFQLLADAVCACFRTYSITIKEHCAKQSAADGGGGGAGAGAQRPADEADGGGGGLGDFFLDDRLCIILNDLEFVSVRLHGLHRFMQVAEVAESHRRRAEREIQGHRGNIKPHGAVRLFHNANSHIQECIISLGGLVADRLCVRLERDLGIIFERFKDPSAALATTDLEATRATDLEDAIDGLVSEQEDLRAALPKNPAQSNRRVLFECTPLYQAVRMRRAIKARDKQLKPDGYVYVNFCILASKMEYLETRNKVVQCFWQNLMVVLGNVLSRQACTETATADQLLGLTMDITKQLTDFLVADGDGVPADELERLSATYLNPICICFRMTSQELVRYLHMNAACAHSGPISDYVHKARGADTAAATERTIPFSMMSQYHLNVQADVTSPMVDVVRLSAGDGHPQNLGFLRLRLLRFGDGARGKSLRVNVVGGMKLPRNTVYVKAKVIASSGEDGPLKFKSQVARGSYNPTFDEGFTVPNCTDGIAVEIRLYEDSASFLSSLASTFKGKRGQPCLGEVLLDLTVASDLEGEAVLDFPLYPVEYTGQLKQAQELLRNRADKIARAYSDDHVQEDCSQR